MFSGPFRGNDKIARLFAESNEFIWVSLNVSESTFCESETLPSITYGKPLVCKFENIVLKYIPVLNQQLLQNLLSPYRYILRKPLVKCTLIQLLVGFFLKFPVSLVCTQDLLFI